jgi:hypothetical protein
MSKLPTEIPALLHVDIVGRPDDIITVTAEVDAAIQTAMIRTHAIVEGIADLNEAAKHWCQTGWAVAYRKHYRRLN